MSQTSVLALSLLFAIPRIFNVDESSLLFTPISEPLSINTEHSVSVEMWKYSENESKMSVIISLDSRSANPSEKYVYQVMSRNKAKESTVINYDVVYQSSTFAYLMINSVPDDFTEVAVRVGYVDRHIEEGNNDENKNVTASFVTVYTNKNKVDKVVSINQLSIVEIYIDKINKENKLIEDDISALKQDNELLEKQHSKTQVVVTFLAVLELMSYGFITAEQKGKDDDILIRQCSDMNLDQVRERFNMSDIEDQGDSEG